MHYNGSSFFGIRWLLVTLHDTPLGFFQEIEGACAGTGRENVLGSFFGGVDDLGFVDLLAVLDVCFLKGGDLAGSFAHGERGGVFFQDIP